MKSSLNARTRKGPGVAVILALLLPGLALATPPTSPTQVLDNGVGFSFELALQVPPETVAVGTIYNRIAGTLVDAGAASVQGVPVKRQLVLQRSTTGQFFVNAYPLVPGQTLPDGIYSQWLELRYTPGDGARSSAPYVQRHNLYFRIVSGSVQRLTLASYSSLVDPAGGRINKLGLQEPVHPGLSAQKVASSQMGTLELIESGEGYSVPDDSEQGQ